MATNNGNLDGYLYAATVALPYAADLSEFGTGSNAGPTLFVLAKNTRAKQIMIKACLNCDGNTPNNPYPTMHCDEGNGQDTTGSAPTKNALHDISKEKDDEN